ncbi:MAG: GldG family protein [Oscillospiraceae bacterium]|nr:GldG family protein [Oscillospiraceae bacterium]
MNENKSKIGLLDRIRLGLAANTKVKFGTITAVIILVAFILFVGINLVFKILDVTVGMDIDMTTQKLYSIDPTAKEFLQSLDKEVTITVIQEESGFDVRTVQALNNYDVISPNITYQYVNLELNPSYANFLKNEDLKDSSIIVQCGNRYRIVDESEMFYTGTGAKILGLRIDQKLCSAINYVTSDEVSYLAVISGHGEQVTNELNEICGTTNKTVVTVSLLTDNLPEDTDTVIISEPTVDYTPAEIKKLEDYMLKGQKTIVVFMDAQVGELPVLEEYLSEWGLNLQNDIVVDTDHYWGGNETYLLAGYDKATTVGKSALEENLNLAIPLARSIEIDSSDNNLSNCTQFAIIKSFGSAYSKAINGDLSDTVKSIGKEPGDKEGTFILGAGSTKLFSKVEGQNIESTLIVYGSAAMLSDSMLTSSVLGNRTVVLDSLLYHSQKLDMMNIPIVAIKDYSINIDSASANIVRIVLMYAIPLIILVYGGYIWISRKKR